MKPASCLPLLFWLWSFLWVPCLADAQVPRLSISSTNDNWFILSWPAASTGYVVESAGLLSGESWVAVTEEPTNANGELRLIRNVTGKAQFFRLALRSVMLPPADFEISGYQLINTTVIGPALSEETYKADLSNWSATDASVSATLTGGPEGVTIVGGSLSFGDVAAGATLESSNVFTVRRDASRPFDSAALVWTIEAKPLPPTTFALIDKALADGRINAETALVYKVYDDFGDNRLPLEYRGRSDGFPDGSAMRAAEGAWATLSPATKQLLTPFTLLPTDPGSWVEIQAARQGALPPSSTASVVNRVAAQEGPSTNIKWSTITNASGKVRIWWMTTLRPGDEARAVAIASEIDRYLWSKLTDLMGEPLPIPKANGVVRLDIYLTGIQRPETKPFSLDADGNQICNGMPLPAVILLGPNDTNSDLAHEIMHAILHGFRLSSCFTPDYRWMHEATATWAEHFAYPAPNPEHGGNGRRGAYSYLQDPTFSLDLADDDREYGAYLWFFFLTRGTSSGTPPYVRQIWEAAATLDGPSAINAAIGSIGGFERQWPEFALYNWNRMADGGEPYRYYHTWDKIKHKAKEHGPIKVKLDGQSSAVETMSHFLPYLSADYFHYDFDSDKKIRRIDFINPVYSTGAIPGAKVQAIVKIRGQPWKPAEDWTGVATKRFCRDRPNEDVEQLVIVISNSQYTPGTVLGEVGQPPEIQVSSLGCLPWEGTVRFTRVFRSSFSNSVSGGDNSFTQVAIEQEDLVYDGRISELVEEDGDVIEPGSTWQSWTFKLAGKFTASKLDSETVTSITKDWTVTSTDVTEGASALDAEGEITIRFDNELFNFVTAGAGLGTHHYEVPLQRTTEQTVECRAESCPQPIPAETIPYGTWALFFAESPGKNTPNAVIKSTNDTLNVVLTRTRVDPFPDPFIGQEETTETFTVDLVRGTRAP